MNTIDAKVIRIISEQSIIINAGADDDLKNGDKIDIVSRGEEIFDGDKSLGFIEYVKETLEITHLEREFSILTKVKRRSTNTSYSLFIEQMTSSLGKLGLGGSVITENADIDVKKKDIEPVKMPDSKDLIIKKGDPVRISF